VSGPPDFEELYRTDADPWKVDTSHYERRKLDIVVASLSRPRYRSAWDPACGTGHLAARLAERCADVLATDAAATAVELTRARCAGLSNVRVTAGRLPAPPPPGPAPDLVVLSEFFYYLDDRARAEALVMIDEIAAPACELLAVHWRHVPDDAWLSGAAAQQEIASRLAESGWSHRLHHDDEEFVIDTVGRRERS
jgi:SAM-dependent methyltransferase